MSVIRVLLIIFALAGAMAAVFTLVGCGCEGEAGASDRLASLQAKRAERAAIREAESRERAERHRRWEAEFDERMNRRDEELSEAPVVEPAPPPKRRRRRIRRFRWESSPQETRGKIWNVPEEESEEATLTAFLRVCIAEADGHPQDCVGIWQVVKNNRRRSCDRGLIRRITECEEGGGETFLSALRRHQRHVLGYIKARNKRALWISKLTTDCENPPEGYPGSLSDWDSRYQKRCSQAVRDGRYLIKGELPPSRPGARLSWLPGRPLTWGGRCESGKAACDDRLACARGLARIPDTGTLNAFWCRPGTAGCRTDPEPVCVQLGYGVAPEKAPPATAPIAAADPPVIASSGG